MIKDELIKDLSATMDSAQLRNTAASLLHLADCLEDQSETEYSRKSIFRWPNSLSIIEREQLNLATIAKFIYNRRMRRILFLPKSLFGEPAWDMLLDLFMHDNGGKRISTQSLCIASNAPPTTALRNIDLLLQEGLVKRIKSEADKRVVFIELTPEGKLAVGKYLLDHPDFDNNIFVRQVR